MTREQKIMRLQTACSVRADGVLSEETLDAIFTKVIGVPPSYGETPAASDGSLTALSPAQRARIFGTFKYEAAPTPAEPDAIRILGGWEALNIVRVLVPQLARATGGAFRAIRFHSKAAKQLLALWAAWEQAGLLPHILSYDGGFAARFVRGSRSTLSNHAFGTAFDLNARWNPLGATPAGWNARGTTRPLVEIAEAHGFFWGGNFRERKDGMHFEVARILS